MKKTNYNKSKTKSIVGDIWSIFISLTLLIYLSIGCIWGIWHPTWVVFPIALAIIGVIDYIGFVRYSKNPTMDDDVDSFDKQFERTFTYAKCVKFSGILFAFTVVTYVVVNSFIGMWHPLWLMFFAMAVIEETCAIIFKARYNDYQTTKAQMVDIETKVEDVKAQEDSDKTEKK